MEEKELLYIIKVYSDGTNEIVAEEKLPVELPRAVKEEEKISQKMNQISEVTRSAVATAARNKAAGLELGPKDMQNYIMAAIKELNKKLGVKIPTIIDKFARKNGLRFSGFCGYLYYELTGKEDFYYEYKDSKTKEEFKVTVTKDVAKSYYNTIMSNSVPVDQLAFNELIKELKEIYNS